MADTELERSVPLLQPRLSIPGPPAPEGRRQEPGATGQVGSWASGTDAVCCSLPGTEGPGPSWTWFSHLQNGQNVVQGPWVGWASTICTGASPAWPLRPLPGGSPPPLRGDLLGPTPGPVSRPSLPSLCHLPQAAPTALPPSARPGPAPGWIGRKHQAGAMDVPRAQHPIWARGAGVLRPLAPVRGGRRSQAGKGGGQHPLPTLGLGEGQMSASRLRRAGGSAELYILGAEMGTWARGHGWWQRQAAH